MYIYWDTEQSLTTAVPEAGCREMVIWHVELLSKQQFPLSNIASSYVSCVLLTWL